MSTFKISDKTNISAASLAGTEELLVDTSLDYNALTLNALATWLGDDAFNIVTFAVGSASTPSVTFRTDLNTGIYHPDADEVGIATGGVARLFVSSSGVSIGTTTPAAGRTLAITKDASGADTSYGIIITSEVQNSVATSYETFRTAPTLEASTALSSLFHFRASQGTFGSGATCTSQYGFYVGTSLTSATNNYGFYGAITAATDAYNLYMGGTAYNYLAGNTGIGVAPDGTYKLKVTGDVYTSGSAIVTSGVALGSSAPTAGRTLDIKSDASGATNTYGAIITSEVQNTVDTYESFKSSPTLEASAALSSLSHFRAAQGTFGTSATATDQYGFYVGTSLTGATNNYAFYSSLASDTGRYNLYMTGTAYNYLAGNTGVGVAPDGTYKLKITGNTYATGNATVTAGISIGATVPTAGRALDIKCTAEGASTSYGAIVTSEIQNTIATGYESFRSYPSVQASANFSSLYHFRAAQDTFGSLATVSSQYGFHASSMSGATNNYGFYGDLSEAATRFNLYMNGTAYNYLNGNTGMGVAPDNTYKLKITGDTYTTGTGIITGGLTIGASAPSAGRTLDITKSISGATSTYGVVSGGEIQSTVTGTHFACFTYPTTAAGGAVSSVVHFGASHGTFSSAVTSQFGFHVPSTFIGGSTANYSFYSALDVDGDGTPANYGIYMYGTARNYLNGNTGVGVAPDGTYKLKVTGSTYTTGDATVTAGISIGNTAVPTGRSLSISNSITGASSAYGIAITSSIASDVTGACYLNYTYPAIALHSGDPLASLVHYGTGKGTYTTSPTNQYCFYVPSTLTGATSNNYGFYGNLAAATSPNSYNLYMAGTAYNYLAGATGIGGAANASYSLKVTGDLYVDGDFVVTGDTVEVASAYEYADGTNSAPAITNIGDTNTGIYFPDANQIAITNDGTQRFLSSTTGITVTGKSGFWNDVGDGAYITRVTDRLLIGDACIYDGNHTPVATTVIGQHGSTSTMDWMEINSTIAAYGPYGIAGTFAVQSDITLGLGGSSIGVIGYSLNNSDDVHHNAWGGYFEVVRESTSTPGGNCIGIEVDVTNNGNADVLIPLRPYADIQETQTVAEGHEGQTEFDLTEITFIVGSGTLSVLVTSGGTTTYIDPADYTESDEDSDGYGDRVTFDTGLSVGDIVTFRLRGYTVGVHIASGGDATVNPDAVDASCALQITSNGALWETGILIPGGALVRDDEDDGEHNDNDAHAICLGYQHLVEWHYTSGMRAAITSIVSSELITERIQFENSGICFKAYDSSSVAYYDIGKFEYFSGASATSSYIGLLGTSVGNRAYVAARGGGDNIDLDLSPKGTGNVRFGTHAAASDPAITGYITIKDSAGTTRKLAVID